MAVYTHLTVEKASAFLTNFEIGNLVSIEGITNGIENTNFLIETDINKFILTIYEKRVCEKDLPFFLNLMEYLSEKGINCPLPVHNRKGNLITQLENKPAAIISFLNGKSVVKTTQKHCGLLGKELAKMHVALKDFPLKRNNSMSLFSWQTIFSQIKDRLYEITPNLSNIIEKELEFLKKNWEFNIPRGIIHADLFPDNALFLGDKIGIIDFYNSCNDYFAYDIAICLNAWCFESDVSFNLTKSRAFLDGYNSVRKLTNNEKENLNILARGATMRFLLSRCYDFFNPVPNSIAVPKNPSEYYHKLMFHQCVKGMEDYGLIKLI